MAALILESNALIWRRGLQADCAGINALLLRGSGRVRIFTLPGQDH